MGFMPPPDDLRATPAPPGDGDYVDPVIEAYKKDVDRSLIRHRLSMSVEDRLVSLERCVRNLAELRQAMIAATKK